jgi:hypothetical protein
MSNTDQVLRKSYKSRDDVQVGKFTVAILDTSNEGQFAMSASANAGPIAGVATESLIPDATQDYSGGKYIIPSGAAWPVGSIPSSINGKAVSFAVAPSIIRVIAGASIAIGQRVNIKATTVINSVNVMGSVKAVSETSGNVYEVGEALRAATNPGDVIRVRLTQVLRPASNPAV